MFTTVALTALALYAVWMLWIVSRDGAAAVRRPSEIQLAAGRMAMSSSTFSVAMIGVGLAAMKATRSFEEFNLQLARTRLLEDPAKEGS